MHRIKFISQDDKACVAPWEHQEDAYEPSGFTNSTGLTPAVVQSLLLQYQQADTRQKKNKWIAAHPVEVEKLIQPLFSRYCEAKTPENKKAIIAQDPIIVEIIKLIYFEAGTLDDQSQLIDAYPNIVAIIEQDFELKFKGELPSRSQIIEISSQHLLLKYQKALVPLFKYHEKNSLKKCQRNEDPALAAHKMANLIVANLSMVKIIEQNYDLECREAKTAQRNKASIVTSYLDDVNVCVRTLFIEYRQAVTPESKARVIAQYPEAVELVKLVYLETTACEELRRLIAQHPGMVEVIEQNLILKFRDAQDQERKNWLVCQHPDMQVLSSLMSPEFFTEDNFKRCFEIFVKHWFSDAPTISKGIWGVAYTWLASCLLYMADENNQQQYREDIVPYCLSEAFKNPYVQANLAKIKSIQDVAKFICCVYQGKVNQYLKSGLKFINSILWGCFHDKFKRDLISDLSSQRKMGEVNESGKKRLKCIYAIPREVFINVLTMKSFHLNFNSPKAQVWFFKYLCAIQERDFCFFYNLFVEYLTVLRFPGDVLKENFLKIAAVSKYDAEAKKALLALFAMDCRKLKMLNEDNTPDEKILL